MRAQGCGISNRTREAAKENSLRPRFCRPWRCFWRWTIFPHGSRRGPLCRHTVAGGLRAHCQNPTCAHLQSAQAIILFTQSFFCYSSAGI